MDLRVYVGEVYIWGYDYECNTMKLRVWNIKQACY